VKIDTVFDELQLQNLDTGNAGQRTHLAVGAAVDGATNVVLTGWVSGSMENADLDVTAKVENLHLPTYSPYFEKFAGVLLESGRLDAVTEVRGTKGNLLGEIQVNLADARVRPSSKADAERIAARVGVPLEMAVDLLKDVDGRIALNLPVTGRVSKPDVGMGPAIYKAVGNVLATIFPPTLIGSMIASLVDGSGPPFASIEFSPGSAELDKRGKSSADSLARLLSEHPHLSIVFCARASEQDRNAVSSAAKIPSRQVTDPLGAFGGPGTSPASGQPEAESALARLAAERVGAVRRYLIEQKGVDAARVSECGSTFSLADEGDPRVEIFLESGTPN
jgi:hypothetical protein